MVLSPYALAMRCPVAYGVILLRTCYALSGTDTRVPSLGRRARGSSHIIPRACYALPCTEITMMLRVRYAMSGTDTGYGLSLIHI
eukprot:3622120-Rhodomonas_salina.2